ncbi:phosphotriesterase [Streptomyces sp. NPDC090106]|uniref:phosphotriesterase family protein n=1 Tax=Streptomyces sp. NPDC090106 TaxID=3365946 RepID=UPI0037F59C58
MPLHTVLGPIDAGTLGPTSMHEHLLSDLRLWARPAPPDEPRLTGPLRPHDMARLRWNALSVPDNLVLHDPEVAAAELTALHAAGGAAVVELTLHGMGRRLAELPALSRRTGVAVCVGTGWYVEATHPDSIRTADTDTLTERLLAELDDGIDGTGIRPALIGELGTGHPPTTAELRVVEAAGQAAAARGCTVNVHVSFRGQDALALVDLLLAQGMPADRIVLSHMDEVLDRSYHRDAAQTGAVLEYDTFGTDFFYGSPDLRSPADHERLDMAEWLLSEGHTDQLVIGCDVWTQTHLLHNGGFGYEHLFRRIAPALERRVGAEAVHRVLVTTPRRLLDRP